MIRNVSGFRPAIDLARSRDWFGAGIAPADVGGDRVALLGVGTVTGAVEREVAQCGELGLVG